jgi:hypothetical protein
LLIFVAFFFVSRLLVLQANCGEGACLKIAADDKPKTAIREIE